MIVGWRVSPQMRSSMVPRRSSATGRCLSRSTLDFEIETFARLVNTRLRADPVWVPETVHKPLTCCFAASQRPA
jgi:hypothetical protein